MELFTRAEGVAVPVLSRTSAPLQLRAGGTSLVVDVRGDGLPRIVHWGADLGVMSGEALVALADAQVPQRVSGGLDAPVPVAVLPEHAAGWLGTPGLAGHRAGSDFAPRLRMLELEQAEERLVAHAADERAGLRATLEIEVTSSGLVRLRATVHNTGGTAFDVEAVLPTLPVPDTATELLDTTGRHLRERSPQRLPFVVGTHLRESRRGRPGADATLLLVAGEEGFGARSGRVWGVHVAWSGNHRVLAERAISGESLLGGGELLLPGEVRLEPGESYESPWLYGSHGDGLDELASRFHDHLRARPHHPRTPRPVTLNTWEAVYFNHDLDRLTELAGLAAGLGVERFVLDDGWFGSRRDDSRGLGDWYVSPEVWPEGLHPLADHVTALGMQFGLWVEPEMVNPDSDLARAHPDWILGPPDRVPPSSRRQQVLDLAHPDAFDHILSRLDALLVEYPIAYLKWDHNRDLVDAGHGPLGTAGVHGQTLAVYRLLDIVRGRHPGLEIESCAAGGARVDLAILERTDRVWASDCIDPIEREQIQRWTELLLPPELIGEHVGAPVSHSTGRQHTLDFRAASAFFGHLGVEWDVSRATDEERARLAEWIAAHKALRGLLHTGRRVHADHPDPALRVHGVVAVDQGEAVYAVVQLTTTLTYPSGWLRLPGLDPDGVYDVRPLPPGNRIEGTGQSPLPWWTDGVRMSGYALSEVGVRAPVLYPERSVLVRATRIDAPQPAHISPGGIA